MPGFKRGFEGVLVEAVYHFSGTPADVVDSGGVAAARVKRLWQTDILSIRVRANAAWNIAPGGAAWIENVSW